MRTESPSCGAGNVNCSNTPCIIAKSKQDIEAAFAIAELSDRVNTSLSTGSGADRMPAVAVVRPTTTPSTVEVTGAQMMPSDCDEKARTFNGARFAHVKSAVMPTRASHVEVKRKPDNCQGVSSPQDHSPSTHEKPVVTYAVNVAETIKLEKDDSVSNEHCVSDMAMQEGTGGRFVRTCKPSSADEFFSRSDGRFTVKTFMSKNSQSTPGLPARCTTVKSGNSFGQKSRNPDVRSVTKHYSMYSVFSERLNEMKPSTSPRQTDNLHLLAGQASTLTLSPSAALDREARVLSLHQPIQTSVTSHSYKPPVKQEGGLAPAVYTGQQYGDTLRSLTQFYYNLGRNSATSQYLPQFVSHKNPLELLKSSLLRCDAASPVLHNFSQEHPKSRSKQHLSVWKSKHTGAVDSTTFNKVKEGEFGSLHALRDYYMQLGRNNVNRQLPERSNSDEYLSRDAVERMRSFSRDKGQSDADMALDLTTKKTISAEDQKSVNPLFSGRLQTEIEALREMGRKSRSCGNSPSLVRVDGHWNYSHMTEQKVPDSIVSVKNEKLGPNLSLPCSPFPVKRKWEEDQTSCMSLPSGPVMTCKVECSSVDNEIDSAGKIPDRQLPLKKRRLQYDASFSPSPTHVSELYENVHAAQEEKRTTNGAKVNLRQNGNSHTALPAVLKPDEDGDLPLHIAVAQGATSLVDGLIRVLSLVGASLDCCNKLKQTPLHIAVLTDQPLIVKQLLIGGSSANVVDRFGQNCLHLAVRLQSMACLHMLLEHSKHQLSLDAVTYDGLTALHLAVQYANLEAVRTLLSAGAQVDATDGKNGRTALFYAVERNDVAMTALLLGSGANPSCTTYSGCSPVQAACATRCSTQLMQLLEKYDPLGIRDHMTCCPTG